MDRPLILNPQEESDKKMLAQLRDGQAVQFDEYEAQIKELFRVRQPLKREDKQAYEQFKKTLKDDGRWVYYPWRSSLVHILPEAEFYEVRTARNKPLFAEAVQKKMREAVVAVAGLSVGSNLVTALIYAGIGRRYKLADPDTVALSNLNRMSAGILDLGLNKTIVAARQIWELDPYAQITIYDQGVTGDNLEEFLTGDPKPTFLFDEVDDISLKFHLRLAARAAQIPLLMVTDNGYQTELSIARFDQDETAGDMERVPKVTLQDVVGGLRTREALNLNPVQEQELIESIIGKESMVPEMKQAGTQRLSGKIAGWPQLQSVASAGSALAVFAIWQILSGNKIKAKSVVSLLQGITE